ncbi:MAG: SDR family oxidoreductase [Bernardetiaceae bacterium]
MKKFALITGANAGIGKETALGLAKAGFRVGMICRDAERAEAARQDILVQVPAADLSLWIADLASLTSVRGLVIKLKDQEQKVDVLLNNAGIFTTDYQTTEDGFERQFGVNHLGHFLLTHLLLDMLREAPQGRIINVSSTAHQFGKIDFDDLHHRDDYSGIRAYGQSKVANVLFTYSLHKRLKNSTITANCLHPGAVGTDFGVQNSGFFVGMIWKLMRPFLISPAEGARTSLHLAMTPDLATVSGKYFDNCRVKPSSEYSRRPEIAERLWTLSADLVGEQAID